MAYDIIIKGGAVLDGTKTKMRTVDVGINGKEIAAIGSLDPPQAKIIVDAAGKYVTPGFIDITNHSDTHLTLFKYPAQESLLMQGVTTIIGGNCGASLAPLGSSHALEAVRKWANPSEINVNWTRVGEFLDEVAKLRLGINFGTLVGHGTLRRGVIGGESRSLNIDERARVKLLLSEGLKEGAFGFSLGLAYGHERVAATEELLDLCAPLKEQGGLLKIHLRSEGRELIASINEVIRISREAAIPVEISHLKAIGRKTWPALPKALEMIQNASTSGADITFDVSPYSTTGSLLYLLVPSWARENGFRELFQKIRKPDERERIIEAIEASTLHYDKILIVSAKMNSIVGKTLAEIAEHSGLRPAEAILDTIRANEGRVKIVGKTLSTKNTALAVAYPNSIVASDGAGYSQEEQKSGNLVHPRSFGAFSHFWHHFVNDLKVLSAEEAIQKIASRPAERIGIKGRGVLKKGNFADIAVFDPRLIRDRATYKNPFRYPSGIEWVLVNGKVAVENGRYTGIRAGHVIKRT